MDKLNVYTNYALKEKTHVGIISLMLGLYIIFLTGTSPKEFNTIFTNVIIQFALLFICIMFSIYNKSLGIFFVIAFTLTFASVYNTYISNLEITENFQVVEDNIDETIRIERDSLLGRLRNREEDVVGVWGCSAWGKEMGLCKI